VEVAITNDINNIFALFSGGRDSLVALHLAYRVARALKLKIVALHVDTTISTPGNIEYVKFICEKLGVNLKILRPKRDYFTLVRKWGFPTITRRWCCYHLKIEPLKLYFKNIDVSDSLVIDGIRAEESRRRKNYPKLGFHKHFKCLNYHPIFNWTGEDVKDYIVRYSLPENPLYAKGLPRASECWCPVFKRISQFKWLMENYPELFNKLVKLESELKSGGSMIFRNGKKIYLRDIK
jgi:3'-phosphoadenosine 5'-phosphosulfate sulfotransferase (PAPS reductase)/FAD synthetase